MNNVLKLNETTTLLQKIKLKINNDNLKKTNLITIFGTCQIWDIIFVSIPTITEYIYLCIRMKPPYKKLVYRLEIEISILLGERKRQSLTGYTALVPFYIPYGAIKLQNCSLDHILTHPIEISINRLKLINSCGSNSGNACNGNGVDNVSSGGACNDRQQLLPVVLNVKLNDMQMKKRKVQQRQQPQQPQPLLNQQSESVDKFQIMTTCSNTIQVLLNYINNVPVAVPADLEYLLTTNNKTIANNG